MASINPGIDPEWHSTDEDIASSDNRSARFIDHLCRDRIRMIFITMNLLCRKSINFDVDGSVVTDFDFLLGNNFGRCIIATDPPADWPHATPVIPARIPRII